MMWVLGISCILFGGVDDFWFGLWSVLNVIGLWVVLVGRLLFCRLDGCGWEMGLGLWLVGVLS